MRRPSVFKDAARAHHPNPMMPSTRGWRAAVAEASIPTTRHEAALKRGLELGLPGAKCLGDKSISTFSLWLLPLQLGPPLPLPHLPPTPPLGIHPARAAEDIREVAKYDATVVGVPFDGGTTYRAGTRFGPQGIRRISSLYTPFNYESGVDLREQMTLCDAGDVFTIPANLEKTFDQITNAIAYIAATGSMPIIMVPSLSLSLPPPFFFLGACEYGLHAHYHDTRVPLPVL
ncbi:hypothetical protein T492DRAFT_623286 [Pavlovales sp. CCMP2436]|nr:hypothetical protein T492DRAFT_623286 [Pavlovales sp. CCMP2436]